MGRAKGTIISLKVPIRWDVMTDRQKTRLSRITGRDTRIIRTYLGVIERHESELLVGKKRKKLSASKLDELTLTASRGKSNRPNVPHDFKVRFPNISVNEFQECRDTAIAMWQSYLELGGSKPLKAKGYSSRKIPRFAFTQRFDFVYNPELEIKHWLILRDSLDSSRMGRRLHEKLSIPLSPSSYHLNKMKEGELKTVRIFKDRSRKWWAIFSVTLSIDVIDTSSKPPAILSIDLGIKKAACSILLAQNGYKHVRYWKQEDKYKQMVRYDNRVASLQREKEVLLKEGRSADSVTQKLRRLSKKRLRISNEYDKKLVKDVAEHITNLRENFDIYVAIGRIRGIRNTARRGNYRGPRFRGMIHRWAFARVSGLLKHKLTMLGFEMKKFVAVPESWTSIKCHKCGHKGIRPKQNLFICHTCGYRANADLNGAINIGRRLIMLISSLKNEKRLGMWLLPKEKITPKASRSSRSKRKSSLPQKSSASRKGESVADCYDQMTLESFTSSKDPAMVKAVEIPSASRIADESGFKMQRTETKSHPRNDIPVKRGKAHVILKDSSFSEAGDSRREKGGTQKFLAVHSHCKK